MKRMTAFALLALASVASADRSFSQDRAVQAAIPFDFTVGGTLLPAGTYTLKEQSTQMISIRNHDKPIVALSLVVPGGTTGVNKQKVVFNRYGDQYFLSEIGSESGEMSIRIPASKVEKRVQREHASLHTGSQTFVAAR